MNPYLKVTTNDSCLGLTQRAGHARLIHHLSVLLTITSTPGAPSRDRTPRQRLIPRLLGATARVRPMFEPVYRRAQCSWVHHSDS